MALFLEDYIDAIENLPPEIKHHLSEVRVRNEQQASLRKSITDLQKTYLKEPNEQTFHKILSKYTDSKTVADEKIGITDKTLELLSRHIKRLDDQIITATKSVEEQGLLLYDSALGLDDGPRSVGGPRKMRKGGNKVFNMGMLSGMDTDVVDDSYDEDAGEPVYCVCQQESYGEMIACDNADSCPFEWFHYGCVGLTAPPQGAWYCPVCAPKFKKKKF